MKYKILLVAVLSSIAAFCQITEYRGFRIENNEVVWRHIYDSSISIADAERIMRSLSHVRNVLIQDSSIVADLILMPIEYSRYGYQRGLTPMIILGFDLNGRIQVDFKPGKFRVTLFELYLERNIDQAFFQSGRFSEHVLKSNRKSFRQSVTTNDVLGLYEQNFVDKFRMRVTRLKNTDW